MIISDGLLLKRQKDKPLVQVGMIGAGYMAKGIALQIIKYTPNLRLAAVSNPHLEQAQQAYRQAGKDNCITVSSAEELDRAIDNGQPAVMQTPEAMCCSKKIDVIIEVTGTIEFAAHAVLQAINHGKQIILMNSELDATLGPILKVYADQAGVIYSNCDGDQPGVIMNLYRFVKGMGFKPVLLGNIKGLHDPYRTPETQKGYAEQYHQKPKMVTSFADGTKISMEMAVVANATGFRAGKRGMFGPACAHVKNTPDIFPLEQMLHDGGWIDYVVGAEPAGGVFVLGYNEDPIQREYLKYYKMGNGPVYAFNTPYHLCHFEAAFSIERVALLQDPVMTPLGPPVVDVLTVAKRDLKAGDLLDGMGGFDTYGVAENSTVCYAQNLLPMGISEGCRMTRDVAKDQALCYDDVDLPPGRLCDRLRDEQNRHFAGQLAEPR
jgi:predicted homoserine dehydrogenase-like protein